MVFSSKLFDTIENYKFYHCKKLSSFSLIDFEKLVDFFFNWTHFWTWQWSFQCPQYEKSDTPSRFCMFVCFFCFQQKKCSCWALLKNISSNVFSLLMREINYLLPFLTELLINPFQADIPFLYPLKTSENRRFCDFLRGYRKGTLARNGLRNWHITLEVPWNSKFQDSNQFSTKPNLTWIYK